MKKLAVLILTGLVGSFGCGGVEAPQRPSSDLLRRSASRIELVEFVVPDPERAARVKDVYVSIETLLRNLERERLTRLQRMPSKNTAEPNDEQVRAEFAAFAKSEKIALQRYFVLQLELRKHLREEEFKRLDELN